jgi:purine-binding chemotaxis protein CheW
MEEERNLIEQDIYDDEDNEDTQKDKYLTFLLGGEVYGLDIRHVTEVVGLQKITHVPDMPDFIQGVINLRGQVIPVMDARRRFRMEPREYDDRTCVVVVNVRGAELGLVVDEVQEVLDLPESQTQPPPKVSRHMSSQFIQGLGKVGEEVKILLDVNRMLFDGELDQVADMN